MSLWIKARDLGIVWGDDSRYWKWTTLEDGSRSEVAELLKVCWLEINGRIDIKMLLLKTHYQVFFVFKLKEERYGLDDAKTGIIYVNKTKPGARFTVFIDKKKCSGERGQFPQPRNDGWNEIKLGEFHNNLGEDGDIEFHFDRYYDLYWKSGLIVKGVDVRPNY